MPLWQAALAAVTLTVYLGWIDCLLLLAVAALYSRLAATALALVWATVLLPARPLLWRGFAQNPLFRWAAARIGCRACTAELARPGSAPACPTRLSLASQMNPHAAAPCPHQLPRPDQAVAPLLPLLDCL
jgi:hypothetical protein